MILKNYIKSFIFNIAEPQLQRVQNFKDIHKGESCYIFGDGISLKWFELKAFPEKPSFILSYLFFHKDFTALNNVYGVLSQPYYFYPYFRLPWPPRTLWHNRIQAQYRKIISQNVNTPFFVNLSNYPVLQKKNVYHHFRTILGSQFAADCLANNEELFGGSLKVAIAHAIHMGFTEIYLVGCDYTHEFARSLHWYEKGAGVFVEQPGYQEKYFNLAQRYTNITTITLEGGGSVLPAQTYEEFTRRSPCFRENTELAEHRDLQLLSTWPGYDIF